jgi:quercetin dioxygenase-like cupin family protein
MQHFPCGSRPTRRPPADWFTGTVLQEPIIQAEEPARVMAAAVHFEPGARTNWHTHPLGQTLHVISGSGLAQSWGGPTVRLNAGDTLWIPPGEKHWHGASPENRMTHIAIQEALDGSAVEWLEPVSDDQYQGAAKG